MITFRASHSSRRFVLAGLGLFLSAPLLLALDPSRSLFEYNIRTWNRQNGLPFNRISALTQTADGFLWMGTQNSLARFDGINFTHVAIPNRPGWYSKSVSCLQNSPRGGLWFGLEAGAIGYFDGTNHFSAFSGKLPFSQTTIRGIHEDADGKLWTGGDYGFSRLVLGSTNQFVSDSNLGSVQAVYKDPLNRLWVGTFENGLFQWQDGRLIQSPAKDLLGVNIRAITMDHDGRIWVGTSWGLRCYDREFKRNDPITIYTEIQALLTDTHGAVWIGTTGDGLIRYLNGEASSLRRTNGLAEDYVSSLCEDREGDIWAGTRDGLTQISDLKFPTPSTVAGPLSTPVHGVCASTNGGVWCATSAGLYNYKGKTVFYLQGSTNATNPYAKRVLEARNGDLYALSGARQIRIFSNGICIAEYANKDWPTALAEDPHGIIASIGPLLYRVSPKELTPFAFNGPAPSFHWIRNLSVCTDGSLLVCSVDGAFRIHDGRIQHWNLEDGIADRDVTCATDDPEGTIWLGSLGGLTRIRHDKASIIHLAETDPSINAIVPDDLGNLWLSCSSGIIQASRRNLNDFADGKTSQLKTKLYDGIDSLRTIDLTEVEGQACKTSDGKVWFGGPLGAIEIDPAHIPADPVPPPVFIDKVLVNAVPQSGSAASNVRRGYGELSFQYTALSFVAPQKIRFQYKLQGCDRAWVDAGSQRSALYANLAPGKYRFLVRACNADGVWSAEDASFAVELPPLFYQTLWFKLAATGFILMCLVGVYGWRTRQLRQKEKSLQAANDSLETRISERTRELLEGRNLLRTLIDNLPDSVFVKDTEGRVIIDNLAHAHYLGFESCLESAGKSDFDCFPRAKAEEFRRPELALLESGKEYNAEENLTLKNGEIRWMLTTKMPLRDAHGKIVGLAGINRDITERKKWEAEMESLHKELLVTSRHAGMAEVATSVLHNVGNVLNSVNISASVVAEQVRSASLERLDKVIQLLKDSQSDLGQFLGQHKKGVKLISYLEALFSLMQKEKATVHSEVQRLTKNIEHIKEIVSMQQSYARVAGVSEILDPTELIEDSLRLHEAAFYRQQIQIIRQYSEVPKICVDRHKVIQILVNLLGNAQYACQSNAPDNRILRLCIPTCSNGSVRIEVSDNGIGIPAENLNRIFSYGFTTRKDGHGFGLHSGALAAREMGGALTAESGGPGKGATFILELPLEYKPAPDRLPEPELSRSV